MIVYALHNGKRVLESTVTNDWSEARQRCIENRNIVSRLRENDEYDYRVVMTNTNDWEFVND